MSVVDSMVSALKADATVPGLLSSATAVYQDYAYIKAAKPYIVVSLVSSVRFPHLASAAGMVESRVQVDCVADTRASRDAIGEAVRDAFDGNMGTIGTDPNDLAVHRIDLEGDVNFTEMPDTGPKRSGQRGTFTRTMDFMVWHNESVPTF